jgi:hypothetical protein
MIALAVSALFTTADARNTRVITGNSTANCSSTTVLDGSWSINTHADGTLLILDKNNTIVRMIADGGTTFIAEKGKDTPDVSTPITLMVDKCGNLHITDNTAFTTGSRAPFALPHEANGWGDPEAAPATHENGTNTIVKR